MKTRIYAAPAVEGLNRGFAASLFLWISGDVKFINKWFYQIDSVVRFSIDSLTFQLHVLFGDIILPPETQGSSLESIQGTSGF